MLHRSLFLLFCIFSLWGCSKKKNSIPPTPVPVTPTDTSIRPILKRIAGAHTWKGLIEVDNLTTHGGGDSSYIVTCDNVINIINNSIITFSNSTGRVHDETLTLLGYDQVHKTISFNMFLGDFIYKYTDTSFNLIISYGYFANNDLYYNEYFHSP
jgi:hypothetical protein